MNAEQREALHIVLLRLLDANQTRFGLGPQALSVLAGTYGFAAARPDVIEKEMDYLAHAQNALAEEVDRGNFNPQNRTWRITPKGRNLLATRGY